MHRYIPNTDGDEKSMLQSIGARSVDALFSEIPEQLLLDRPLAIPNALSEPALLEHFKQLGKKNTSTEDVICFLGAGAYDHHIPSAVSQLVSRSEFYTAYTPYQPEISQGTLQAIFEYQSMICALTGLDATNASMYDGPTAAVEASALAVESTKRKTVAVSRTVSPEVRKVLQTYFEKNGICLLEIAMADGRTDLEALKANLDANVAAVIVQQPNFFGILEEMDLVSEAAHANRSLLISYVNPISLGLLKPPSDYQADLAVGDGQPLGNELNFGGPSLGFLAADARFLRKIPGRIVGQSKDVDDKRAFVLTLQAREQHIRRARASSNICSNQGLNALTAAVYLSLMGKKGLRAVAEHCFKNAHYALDRITESGHYRPLFNQPFFHEFVLTGQTDFVSANAHLLQNGILGGYVLQTEYPELGNAALFCTTEKRTKAQIDLLAELMEACHEQV